MKDFDEALELANDRENEPINVVHSNNREKIDKVRDKFFVGNLYINRILGGGGGGGGRYGGFNMSGTDSKAGGPDYLLQFLQNAGRKSHEILDLTVLSPPAHVRQPFRRSTLPAGTATGNRVHRL